MLNQANLNEILLLFPMRIKNLFFQLSDEVKKDIREIRLRNNKPIVVVTKSSSSFLAVNSKLTYIMSDALPVISQDELNEIVKRACNYSVYSHQEDMNSGYITVKGANRIGICASAVTQQDKVISVNNISSVNIRIAGEYFGCADSIVRQLFYRQPCNLIVAGPPMSGKTTVIRDLARQLSNGNTGKYYKCVIADERNEIACVSEGRCGCDVGVNTDILSGYKKEEAINIAIRVLSPEIVFCDEISSVRQARSISDGIMCGTSFVISAHADSVEGLLGRPATKLLLSYGLFDYAVFLGRNENVGKVIKIVNLKEKEYENSGNADNCIGDVFDSQLLRRAD